MEEGGQRGALRGGGGVGEGNNQKLEGYGRSIGSQPLIGESNNPAFQIHRQMFL